MTLKLYAHPFSSYCQKVLIALYGNNTPFKYLTLDDAKNGAELESLWPIRKFPVLVDGGARFWKPASSSSIWTSIIQDRCV